jgi:hypothetical protein
MLTLQYTVKKSNQGVNLFPLFMNASVDGIIEEGKTLKITIETFNESGTNETVRFIEGNLAKLYSNQAVELTFISYTDEKETLLELQQKLQQVETFSVEMDLHRFKKSSIQVEPKVGKVFSESERNRIISEIFLILEKERDEALEELLD